MRTALHLCLRAGRIVACSAVFLSAMAASPAADCNGNGVEDAADLSPGTIAFAAAPFLHEVLGLTGLVGADLDGDSDVDLVAGSGGGSIFVFPCLVAGEEGPRFRQWPAVSVHSLAAADLEGDGDIDLAVAGRGMDGKLAVLVNRGDASFDPPHGIPLPETPVTCLAAADLDADGDADLAAAVPFGVHVFSNAGGGTFEDPVRLLLGSRPHAVAAADLDLNGLPDLVTANFLGDLEHDDNVSVILNGGGGRFLAPRNFAAGRGLPSLSVKDLDGDGDLDPAVLNKDSRTITGFSNDGKGDLSPRELFTSERTLNDEPVLVMDDLDQDGAMDIALAGGVLAILFQRMGAFPRAMHFMPPRSRAPGLATADVDCDGDPDLAFTDEGGVGVLRNTGAGVYGGRRLYFHGSPLESLAAGDLDSDGDADLVTAARYRSTVSVLLNDGKEGFTDPSPRDAGTPPVGLALGDLDADGDLDAATAGGSPDGFSASLLFNDGKGTFPELMQVSWAAWPRTVTMARIDADDRDDLVFTNETDSIDVRLTNRDRTFRAKEVRVPGHDPRLVAGDFDGDGDVDLVAATWSSLSLALNDGNGDFAPPRELAGGDPLPAIAAGDLNADGLLDLVNLGLAPAVLLNTGGGGFDVRQAHLPGGTQFAVRAADVDGDLDQDLVSTTFPFFDPPHVLTILGNQGDGSFLPPVEVSGLGQLLDLVAVDLNGDGLVDVAGSGNDVVVMLNETVPPRSLDSNRNRVPDECEAASFRRGDANDSGGLDITDAVFLLAHLFRGEAGPPCEKGADADDDGDLRVTDAIRILGFLFRRGEPPPAPFPACGVDPTADGLECMESRGCP
jgi:hypothetical protein